MLQEISHKRVWKALNTASKLRTTQKSEEKNRLDIKKLISFFFMKLSFLVVHKSANKNIITGNSKELCLTACNILI